MTQFMNLVTMMSPNLGSGMISRRSARWRRDMDLSPLLRTLHAVFRTALLTVLDALGIQNAAEDVVTDAGKVLHAAAADHDHGVFLKVMTFARDVTDDFEAIGEAHFGDLAKRRVRLLRGRRVNACAYAALLRARLKMAGLFAID